MARKMVKRSILAYVPEHPTMPHPGWGLMVVSIPEEAKMGEALLRAINEALSLTMATCFRLDSKADKYEVTR